MADDRHSGGRGGHGGQHRQRPQHQNQNQHHQRGGGGRPRHHHRSSPQTGSNVAQEIIHAAGRRIVNASHIGIFLRALLAGGLLVIAMAFAGELAAGATLNSVKSIMLGFGLSTGLFLIISSNCILMTEANVIVPYNFYKVSVGQGFMRLFLFWVIAWLGNWLGAWLFAWILNYVGMAKGLLASFKGVVNTKVDGDFMDILRLVLSGVLANWIIGFAAMFTTYNRAAMGKILILFVTICLIVGTGLQYYPINVAYFSLLKTTSATGPSWLEVITRNLLPITIGNLLGGMFLVIVPLLSQSKRK